MQKRRSFLQSAIALSSASALPGTLEANSSVQRMKVTNGIRIGNLYFSSGTTGVRSEAHEDPLAFGGDVKEQTHTILKTHKANLEAMGSSLENVLQVTVFMADIKTEKNAMNEIYAEYFPKDPPARTAVGVEFPLPATRLEIEIVAWIPSGENR
jgi:2-iminobutanoate/2-iminopropanoate deaminase